MQKYVKLSEIIVKLGDITCRSVYGTLKVIFNGVQYKKLVNFIVFKYLQFK